MAIYRLVNGAWTDVDFTGQRLVNGVWIEGQATGGGGAITGTGSLTSQVSTVSGVGDIAHTGTGSLTSQVSTVSGVGILPPYVSDPVGNQTNTEGDFAFHSVTFNDAGVTHVSTTNTGGLPAGISFTKTTEVGREHVWRHSGTISAGASSGSPYSMQSTFITEDGTVTDDWTWTINALITGTGSLTSQVSTLSGTGGLSGVITGTGGLTAQSSSVSGVGGLAPTVVRVNLPTVSVGHTLLTQPWNLEAFFEFNPQNASRTLEQLSPVPDGVTANLGTHFANYVSYSGTLSPTSAGSYEMSAKITTAFGSVTGTGTWIITDVITGTGSLTSQVATSSGVGDIAHTGTGSLTSQVATSSGVGGLSGDIFGTGGLDAQSPGISGTGGLAPRANNSNLQTSWLVDVNLVPGNNFILWSNTSTSTPATNFGDLPTGMVFGTVGVLISHISGTPTVKGTYNIQHEQTNDYGTTVSEPFQFVVYEAITGTGDLDSQSASVSGVGSKTQAHTGTGSLTAEVSSVDGSGGVGDTGTGSLAANDSTMSGAGLRIINGTGSLLSEAGTVVGAGNVKLEITATGSLSAQDATMSGAGVRVVNGTGVILAQSAIFLATGDVIDPGQNFEKAAFDLGVSRGHSVDLGISRGHSVSLKISRSRSQSS